MAEDKQPKAKLGQLIPGPVNKTERPKTFAEKLDDSLREAKKKAAKKG